MNALRLWQSLQTKKRNGSLCICFGSLRRFSVSGTVK